MKEVHKESVVIEWTPPLDDGGLALTKYGLEKCDPEKKIWIKVADLDKDVESFCIQKLLEGSEYLFRVYAANPIGYSEAIESDPVFIRSSFGKIFIFLFIIIMYATFDTGIQDCEIILFYLSR